ncbi:MAG: cyclase family protein, partial [Dehalococcoidia bacterium]|nr:cyclase family protein [Dehalococcoidia bacterium]
MKVWDITVTVRPGMPSYPGEPGPAIESIKSIDRGDAANVSLLSITTHTGTHMDAPCHFIPGGVSVDRIPPEALVGRAVVVEMAIEGHIGARELEAASLPQGVRRVLFKTHNSRFWEEPVFRKDFTAVGPDGALWLVQHGFTLVGIDYLSVEPFHSPAHETHRTLLGAGIVILE